MRKKYEKRFNSPKSTINVDNTWGKFEEGKYPMRDRYDYSLQHLVGNVLEVGAGDGFFTYKISRSSQVTHVVALEIQDKAIERMTNHLEGLEDITIVKGIIEEFNNDPTVHKFDSVHCGHTLEHVLDVPASLKVIQEINATVNVISVPIRGGLSKQHLTEWRTSESFLNLIREYFVVTGYHEFVTGSGKTSLVVIAKSKE